MVSSRVSLHDSVYYDSLYYDAALGGKHPDYFKTPAMRAVQALVKRWSNHVAWNIGDAYHLWQGFKLRMIWVTQQQVHVRSQLCLGIGSLQGCLLGWSSAFIHAADV